MLSVSFARRVETLATVILALCAVLVAGLFIRREFLDYRAIHPEPEFVQGWEQYAIGNGRLGPKDAQLTVVVFSDYQCPFCRDLAIDLDSLMERRPTEVAVVYRDFPIPGLHPHAKAAAAASKCAAVQGRFPAFHGILIQHPDSMGLLSWTDLARRAEVPDTSAFRTCLSDSSTASALRADSVAAVRLGITGTPMLMVNGWRHQGNPTKEQLKQLLSRASREDRP